MSQPFANWDDESLDLALQAFTEGLDERQLRELRSSTDAGDLDALEHSIAAIHWTQLEPLEPVPQSLMERLEQQALAWMGTPQASSQSPHSGSAPTAAARPPRANSERHQAPAARARQPWVAVAGWAAAAVMAVLLFTHQPDAADNLPSTMERMQALVAAATDLKRIDWSATEDPIATGAQGEVVWSDARQEGYMVFRGLRPNNPTEDQYQLWIFDPTRADWEALPVDGGVFDVGPDGEAIVPIVAKLPVSNAALFAITLEKPGGVVVSKREHLLLTAAVPS
ncbi:MAG: anti-sigma factor [Planctomycetes bacterium]|nr:anti-sigma factor [Planctomycetota bacterium]HPF14482.1 anti-sigma factor [Planctomycetota bacterium]HRV79977.1 anti-sigma factor [Planctomycetota bacterium]